MQLKDIAEVTSAGEATQIAIDWQNSMDDESPSYGELMTYQGYFTALAGKFGLVEEFKENGII